MKVYIYFLTPPVKPHGKYTEAKIDAFHPVVRIFDDNYYKRKPGVIFELNGAIRYLYAYTTDKSMVKDFEYMHDMDLFTRITRKMDRDEFSMFQKEMDHAKLEYYKMDDGSNMLVTKLENHILETSIDDIELHLSNHSCLGYEAFKDEYIQALDILLYTLYYQLAGPDSEFYGYNYNYGLTPEGAVQNQVNMVVNFKTMYVQVFSLILK